MSFKNQIRQMATIIGKTLLTMLLTLLTMLLTMLLTLLTMSEVLLHSPRKLRWNGINFLSDPFLQILKRLKILFPKGFQKEKVFSFHFLKEMWEIFMPHPVY